MKTILCVDDDESVTSALKRQLRNVYDVHIANNAQDAMTLIERLELDLILTDVMMPGMNGFSLCRMIKADKRFARIPVVFLTGRADTIDVESGFCAGGADYITKPFASSELKARLNLHIQLHDTVKELTESKSEKSHYLRMVSHDINNPLFCIKAYSEIMIQMLETDPVKLENIKILTTLGNKVIRSAEMIQAMTNDILLLEEIESNSASVNLFPIDVIPIVETVIDNYQELAYRKNIQLFFVGSESIYVNAESRTIARIAENLISNAIKYSPKNKSVYIEFKVVEVEENAIARLKVKDQGPGILPEEHSRLFKKFSRLSSIPTGGEPSTGMGLAIVKALAESMNGNVFCKSLLGEGAAFYVDFPIA